MSSEIKKGMSPAEMLALLQKESGTRIGKAWPQGEIVTAEFLECSIKQDSGQTLATITFKNLTTKETETRPIPPFVLTRLDKLGLGVKGKQFAAVFFGKVKKPDGNDVNDFRVLPIV
jgi:hypothetical protein